MVEDVDREEEEIERLDYVHSKIAQLLCDLAGQDVPWDINVIGEISDLAEKYICSELQIMPPEKFSPFVIHKISGT